MDRCDGCLDVLAVARGPVAHQRSAKYVDVEVSDLSATVVALIDDDRVLVGLGVEVSAEVIVPRPCCVGHIYVGHPFVGCLVDSPDVSFDPVPVPEPALAGYGHHRHGAGT